MLKAVTFALEDDQLAQGASIQEEYQVAAGANRRKMDDLQEQVQAWADPGGKVSHQ